jgi:copper resistance protein D
MDISLGGSCRSRSISHVANLIDIFSFITVLLRGLTLSLEAATVGGVIFSIFVDKSSPGLRFLGYFAGALAFTQICNVTLTASVLTGTTDVVWADLIGAGFLVSGLLMITGAVTITLLGRAKSRLIARSVGSALILVGSVMNSHAFARLEHRGLTVALTLAHHVAGAAWFGGLLFLMFALRKTSDATFAARIAGRFSRLAVIAVPVVIAAGVTLSLIYVRSPSAMAGTTYGIMLISKVILTAAVLGLGALNLRIVTLCRKGGSPSLLPLNRFAEAELAIGFTILLAAASLTSTPPAIDVRSDLVRVPEMVHRMLPRWPSLQTPSLNELSPATPLSTAKGPDGLQSFVPGQRSGRNTRADIEWSEYNHHWAGLIVFAMGLLALFSRWLPWARSWPLIFFGLAIFLFIRADAENWPLGPRSFWESFQVAEVAQHRLFILLIVVFAVFEWTVQTGRIAPSRAGLVFPMVCVAGGALLMTHSHSLGNVREEYFAELSHLPLSILAVIAGCSRWLEIRLPQSSRNRLLALAWPACFILIGSVLICYREM